MGFRISFDDKPMELLEHLGELRKRLMRSILLLLVGATVAYQFFPQLYSGMLRPLHKEMGKQHALQQQKVNLEAGLKELEHVKTEIVSATDYNLIVDAYNSLLKRPPSLPLMGITFRNFFDPFMVRLNVSVIGGFILVLPGVLWQLFAFILPALTPNERKPLRFLIPLSTLLTIAGLVVGYTTMFFAMHWFLAYLGDYPEGANLQQDPQGYVVFFAKMMAAFAIAFQLPVVIMLLAYMNLLTSEGLIKHWRWGVVLAVLGGVFTPSNDLISMALMSGPLLILYVLSIFLVKGVERARKKRETTFAKPEPVTE